MTTSLSSGSEFNPYSAVHEPKKYNVAKLLLSGDTVSYDDLRLVAGGTLSPRTFGQILRDLEGQQLSFLRIRDPALGSLYRFDPLVPFDERFRLGKTDGPDALRHTEQAEEAEEEVVDEEASQRLTEIIFVEPDEVPEPTPTKTVGGVSIDTIFFHDEDGVTVIDSDSLTDLRPEVDEEPS